MPLYFLQKVLTLSNFNKKGPEPIYNSFLPWKKYLNFFAIGQFNFSLSMHSLTIQVKLFLEIRKQDILHFSIFSASYNYVDIIK